MGGVRDAVREQGHVGAGGREHFTRQARRKFEAAADMRLVIAPCVKVPET